MRESIARLEQSPDRLLIKRLFDDEETILIKRSTLLGRELNEFHSFLLSVRCQDDSGLFRRSCGAAQGEAILSSRNDQARISLGSHVASAYKETSSAIEPAWRAYPILRGSAVHESRSSEQFQSAHFFRGEIGLLRNGRWVPGWILHRVSTLRRFLPERHERAARKHSPRQCRRWTLRTESNLPDGGRER